MKGIIFTSLQDMITEQFSEDLWDEIIDNCELKSNGIYTTVGNYDFEELQSMVNYISNKTKIKESILIHEFGKYLASIFIANNPQCYESCNDLFYFLDSIDNNIHVEVRKLYDNTYLPLILTKRKSDREMELLYTSKHKLVNLACGLIEGSSKFYNQKIDMEFYDVHKEENTYKIIVIKK